VTLLAVSTSLMASGNGENRGKGTGSNTTLPVSIQAAIEAPTSTLSQALTNTLAYMGNEERLAYDVYNELYAQWGSRQFTNIASKSEYKHITAVQALVKKYKLNDDINFTNVDLPALGYKDTNIKEMEAGTYDISKIQRLYDDLISQGSGSEIDALKVGCIVEVVDVNDLDAYISLAKEDNATDIITVFDFLRKGSYNHYWAFDKGLKNKGENKGCCAVGQEYCHPEYPKKGEGKGQGKKHRHGGKAHKGRGRGHGPHRR